MVKLIPVVRVNEPTTRQVMDIANVIVIRLQDFVSKYTFEPNFWFNRIAAAGGLHKYLKFSGVIILSLVMRDDIIFNFLPKNYANMINKLKPDFWTTVDGETYEGEYSRSEKEIERCFAQTKEILSLSPHSVPIGHIKGCCPAQILAHCFRFKALGIQDFIFHTGDFLKRGDTNLINIARSYAYDIRKQARTLILYGMGAPSRFLEFSFADAFITFRHFVSATHGLKIIGSKEFRNETGYNSKLVMENFLELRNCVQKLNNQKTLFMKGGVCTWAADQEVVDQCMLQVKTKIKI